MDSGLTEDRPVDFIQWVLDVCRKNTPTTVERLLQHAMGLFFGAAHQLPMLVAFALASLCEHPRTSSPCTPRSRTSRRSSTAWTGPITRS